MGGRSTSKFLNWLLAERGCLQVIELNLSFADVGRRPPSVSCDMWLSMGQLTTRQLASSEQQGRRTRESMKGRQKSFFYNLAMEVTLITFAMFPLLEASHSVLASPKVRIGGARMGPES